MSNPYYRTTRDAADAIGSGSKDDTRSKRFDPHHHGSFPRSGSGSVGQERSGLYDGPPISSDLRPQIEFQQEPFDQHARSDVATYEPTNDKVQRNAVGAIHTNAHNGYGAYDPRSALAPHATYPYSDPYVAAQQEYNYTHAAPSPYSAGPSTAPARQNPTAEAHAYYTDPYAEASPASTTVYPPRRIGANESSHLDVPTEEAHRPDTPGLHPDKPLNRAKLTPAQVKIADQFPKDLDKEGGSIWEDVKQMMKDWRSYVKWRYLRECVCSSDLPWPHRM